MRKYIYDAIKTKSKAAMRLKANGNVFVTSSGYAYDACKAASPIHKVSAMQNTRRKRSGKTILSLSSNVKVE
mgnify:CR=1 FL=1